MATQYGTDSFKILPQRRTWFFAVALALVIHLIVVLGFSLELPDLQVARTIPFELEPMPAPKAHAIGAATSHGTSKGPARKPHTVRAAPVAVAPAVATAASAQASAQVPVPIAEAGEVSPATAPVAQPMPAAEPPPVPPLPRPVWVVPPSARLKYNVTGEVKGLPYFVFGELLWVHQADRYSASMEISHFLLGSRMQTSTGALTDSGVSPSQFTDKVHAESSATLDRLSGKASFSDGSAALGLEPGAQDQLSVYLQLALLLASASDPFAQGVHFSFQTVGAHAAEHWNFRVGPLEPMALPAGDLHGLHLTGESTENPDTKVDVWLSPEIDFMPARIRMSQANGDFVEQQLRQRLAP